MSKVSILNKNYIGKDDMKYGIYTIQNESEISKNLIEDKYTFYVKINGKDIKDYEFDYLDIMQNAFLFHTKDCINNPMAFRDWMADLSWLYYNETNDTGYKNIILVFEHWNEVGKRFFNSGEKLRTRILEDFIETESDDPKYNEGILRYLANDDSGDFIFIDSDYNLEKDCKPTFQVFNIYLIL